MQCCSSNHCPSDEAKDEDVHHCAIHHVCSVCHLDSCPPEVCTLCIYWACSGPVPGMNFPAVWRSDVVVLCQPEWTATNQILFPLSLQSYVVTPSRPSSIGQQLEPLHRAVQVFFPVLLNFWRLKSWSVFSRGMWSVFLQTQRSWGSYRTQHTSIVGLGCLGL